MAGQVGLLDGRADAAHSLITYYISLGTYIHITFEHYIPTVFLHF
jgi:hypothetical protein